MSFSHSHSSECMSSELDLFTLPTTQTSIEGSNFFNYKPVSSIPDEGDAPIKFVVPSASEHYIDFAHTMLYVKAPILPVADPDLSLRVVPVNDVLHSMFNQIDIFINQKLVSSPNNAYPYRQPRSLIQPLVSGTMTPQIVSRPRRKIKVWVLTRDSSTVKTIRLAEKHST